MEGNIKKGFHFAHIFESTLKKKKSRAFLSDERSKISTVSVTSLSEDHSAYVGEHQGRSHSQAPPGSEASSALTHSKRIWRGRFHLYRRICLREEF